MRWFLLFFIILVSIPLALAIDQDYNNYSSLDMSFEFKTSLQIHETGPNPQIENINVDINTYPKDTNYQEIKGLNVHLDPPGEWQVNQDQININWDNPDETLYNIKVTADITAQNTIIGVSKPIKFPSASTLFEEYTDPSEHIDINPEIRKQAQELAAGKTDYYQVVFDVAKWVKRNVEYNLTEITADEIQDSSWVFENRIGVCDELTNLFMSMTRSLGIPSRFVTGLAYSNLKGEWEPHAWAEVYFPGQNHWIPFDVTYGQLGWLDPTHIRLSESIGSATPSTTYKWKASGMELKVGASELKAKLKQKNGALPKLVAIEVNPLVKKAGPGSYIPIEVTIKNGQDIYIPEQLYLTKAPEVYGFNNQWVLLKPNEVKKIYWLIRAPIDVEVGYMYTSQIEVQDTFHIKSSANISFASNYEIFTKEQAEEIIAESSGIEESKAESFDFKCESADYVYLNDIAVVNCMVYNKLDVPLDNVRVCAVNVCQDLSVEDKEKVTIELIPEKKGFRSYIVLASYKGENIEEVETLDVLDSPDFRAIELDVPNELGYEETANINFVGVVQAPVKDVHIFVNGKEVMSFDDLIDSKKVVIKFSGKNIYPEEKVILDIKYQDENGKEYQLRKEKEIIVKNVPWYVPMLNFLGLI